MTENYAQNSITTGLYNAITIKKHAKKHLHLVKCTSTVLGVRERIGDKERMKENKGGSDIHTSERNV